MGDSSTVVTDLLMAAMALRRVVMGATALLQVNMGEVTDPLPMVDPLEAATEEAIKAVTKEATTRATMMVSL